MEKTHAIGIVFNKDLNKVLCVKKNRPEFLKGNWNAPGGRKEEEDKDILDCCIREVEEETDITIPKESWSYVATINRKMWFDCFVAVYEGDETDAKQMTDEEVGWIDFQDWPTNTTENMRWLIPMAANRLNGEKISAIVVEYD